MRRRTWLGAALALATAAQAEPQVYLPPFYGNTNSLNPEGKPQGTVLASDGCR